MHDEAYRTSYISPPGAGDVSGGTSDTSYPYSTLSTFVVSELDVQADDDTLVVRALGDSITDGTFSTTNGSDRWSDALSIRLHRLLGNHVSVVNAGIGGNTVEGSLNSPPVTERLDRDVLSLAGLRIVTWLKGSNDIDGLQATPQAVEAEDVDVVHRLHARGVGVVGLTLTSARPPGDVVPTNSPLLSESAAFAALYASAHYDADRKELNAYIKIRPVRSRCRHRDRHDGSGHGKHLSALRSEQRWERRRLSSPEPGGVCSSRSAAHLRLDLRYAG